MAVPTKQVRAHFNISNFTRTIASLGDERNAAGESGPTGISLKNPPRYCCIFCTSELFAVGTKNSLVIRFSVIYFCVNSALDRAIRATEYCRSKIKLGSRWYVELCSF